MKRAKTRLWPLTGNQNSLAGASPWGAALHNFTTLHQSLSHACGAGAGIGIERTIRNSSEDVTCDSNACYDAHHFESAAAAKSSCCCPRVSFPAFSPAFAGADHTRATAHPGLCSRTRGQARRGHTPTAAVAERQAA